MFLLFQLSPVCTMDIFSLIVSLSKTQLIVIGNASNVARVGQVSLEVNGTVILSSDCIKSLGLQIDSKLSWSQHINSLSRRYHFMAKSLYPLKPLLSSINFFRIIEACLISLSNYMIVVWGNSGKENIRIVERCLRSSARILMSKRKHDRVLKDLYGNLGWLMPSDSHKYFSLCLIYKILKLECIPYFRGVLSPNLGLASHDTRAYNNLYISNIRRNKFGMRSFLAQPLGL
jgi:hypothetical protein